MTRMYTPAELTVVLVCYNSSNTILDALGALAAQTVKGAATMVVDSSTDDTSDLVRRHFPDVLIVRSSQRLYPGGARNRACREIQTPLIAFVDSDCLAAPDWVARILEAHQAPDLIIGGSVGVANPGFLAGWASYLCEFSPWFPAGSPRHMQDIPTCCLSLKRSAFEQFGPFLETGYCSDTHFNWRAHHAGASPLFDPSIHVLHINPRNFSRTLRKLVMHGRTYARLRASAGKWPASQSLLRCLAAPLVAPYLALRSLARASAVPAFRTPALLALPFLLCSSGAWSFGEMLGYADSLSANANPSSPERP